MAQPSLFVVACCDGANHSSFRVPWDRACEYEAANPGEMPDELADPAAQGLAA
jgi:hypothetical protein